MDMSFLELLQPQWYVENGGILLIMFVVFAETGLFAGFFLPGDSLLFVTGVLSKSLLKNIIPDDQVVLKLVIIILLISISGILGNIFGYWFGLKGGKSLYAKKDTLLFKHNYLVSAKNFYDKHGPLTIFVARFIPFIRTFAPIVAGTVNMNYRKFILYNISGSFAWSISFILAGHYLNDYLLMRYNYDIGEHLGYIVFFIVLVTTIPFITKVVFLSFKNK
jgi:membrane-associated protein